jgi:itaconyl-CoA hydratase
MTEHAPLGYRPVAVGRFRENVGFGYQDFVVGTVIEHRPGRTVTEMDNVLMTTLTGNTAPIHLDAHYSSKTEWGRPLVCLTHTDCAQRHPDAEAHDPEQPMPDA